MTLLRQSFTILFVLFFNFIRAQTISAIVYDYDTKEPIVGASIYYDGTTIGVATDANGKFDISYEPALSVPIVISFIGYSNQVHSKEELLQLEKVYLKASSLVMKGLVIKADNWSRDKKMRIFKSEFLGRTPGVEYCRITNEKDIRLVYNPTTNELYAFCDQPMIIINRYLGYKIMYNMNEFEVQFRYSHGGLRLTEQVYYEGTSFFSELGKSVKKKYAEARWKEFKGSKMHFMRSLAEQKLTENRFEIFYKSLPVDPYEFFTINNLEHGSQVSMSVDTLSILYHRVGQSMILLDEELNSFFIDDYGIHSTPESIKFGGVFGTQRISSMLPQNYSLYRDKTSY